MAAASSIRVSLGTGLSRLGAPIAGLRKGLVIPLGIILFFVLKQSQGEMRRKMG